MPYAGFRALSSPEYSPKSRAVEIGGDASRAKPVARDFGVEAGVSRAAGDIRQASTRCIARLVSSPVRPRAERNMGVFFASMIPAACRIGVEIGFQTAMRRVPERGASCARRGPQAASSGAKIASRTTSWRPGLEASRYVLDSGSSCPQSPGTAVPSPRLLLGEAGWGSGDCPHCRSARLHEWQTP